MSQHGGLTRRRLFIMAAGVGAPFTLRLYGASSEFWNKKDPGEWSSEEIDKLVSKSPWAKQVNAASSALSRPYAPSGNGGGRGGPGSQGGYPGASGYPGGGAVGGMGGGGRVGDDNAMPLSYTAIVRWESAKPVRDAVKTPLPASLAGDYVIAVSGVPLLVRGRQRTADGDSEATISKGLGAEELDRIRDLTYLEPKGKPPAQPAAVIKGPVASSGTPTLLFGFPREVLPLTEDDREVVFTTKLEQIEIRAKFTLKDMMYHKELAL